MLCRDKRPIKKDTWLVRWYGEYDPTTDKQKRYSNAFRTKVQAERFKQQKQTELDAGASRDFKDINLENFFEKYLETRTLAPSSLRDYEDTINRMKNHFNPKASIKNIRPEDAEHFISSLKIIHPDHARTRTKISDSTRNKIIKTTKVIFKTAQEWGYNDQQHLWGNEKMLNNELRKFQTLCKKAGIDTDDRLNLHCLRKAFGTNLARNNICVDTICLPSFSCPSYSILPCLFS
ncbi:MAG: phage integrase SAM-like domain-containing protein [Phycisphaerae bacterium]|nr:phage integrase SAM-like domain-containing protein [Phycisphaerae bacterium]